MSKSRHTQLVSAMNARQLVSLSRRFEDARIRGYVLTVGEKFFLLALVSDRIRYDGFECFRISDIRSVQADPYARFVELALKKRGEKRARKPKVNVDSVESLLLSANKAFPLVTIHLEKHAPDVCYIGRVCGVDEGKVSLLGITPAAVWENAPNRFSLKKITRVNFGGDYEDALHRVGDDPKG